MAFYDCLASLTDCRRQLSIALRIGRREETMHLEVGKDMEIANLKGMIEGDTSIPVDRQLIYYHNKVLNDNTQTLESVGLADQDVLEVYEFTTESQVRAAQALSSQQTGTATPDDAETLRLSAHRDPSVMQQLRQHRPELAEVVPDQRRFREVWNGLMQRQREARLEEEQNIQRLNDGPIDTESQKTIEEMIRERQVMDNLQDAIEFMPESKPSVLCNVHPSRHRPLTLPMQSSLESTCSMSLLR